MTVPTPIRAGWRPVSERAHDLYRSRDWAWTRETAAAQLRVTLETRYAQWRITHDDGVFATTHYCPGSLSIDEAMSRADGLETVAPAPVPMRKAS